MASTAYGDVVAANIRAARSRRGVAQAVVVERMRALGFTSWHRQTLGNVERGERRVTMEEIFCLALALETTIPALATAADQDEFVDLPNGQHLGSVSVERLAGRGVNDHAVQWPDGGTAPLVMAVHRRPQEEAFDREVLGPHRAAQGWPYGSEAASGES
jgi:transcriptional regulator with XRE-family HTH domain